MHAFWYANVWAKPNDLRVNRSPVLFTRGFCEIRPTQDMEFFILFKPFFYIINTKNILCVKRDARFPFFSMLRRKAS